MPRKKREFKKVFLQYQPNLIPNNLYVVIVVSPGFNGVYKGYNFKDSICNNLAPLTGTQVQTLRKAGKEIAWFDYRPKTIIEKYPNEYRAYVLEEVVKPKKKRAKRKKK